MGNHGGAQPGETAEEESSRRRGKESAPAETQAADVLTPPEHKAQQQTPPTRPCGGAGPSRFRPTTHVRDRGASATSSQNGQRKDRRANTPWGLWSAARKEKKDVCVAQGSLTATMDDSRRHKVNEHMKGTQHEDFGRKA